MQHTKPANLCEVCRKRLDCMRNGILQQQNCNQYDPLSLEELAQRDEVIRDALVGSCPSCGSEKTYDCDNFLELLEDTTVGYCLECGVYWCLECGSMLDEMKKKSRSPRIEGRRHYLTSQKGSYKAGETAQG